MTTSTLKMKELENRTGVSRETIRFYIREGILPEPVKPKRNVAHYSEEHVLRIKMIKKLQDEKFLPLGVIKDLLNTTDLPIINNLENFELAFLSLVNGEATSSSSKLTDIAEKSAFSREELFEMHLLGIINIEERDDDAYITRQDAAIVQQWSQLKSLGYRDEFGYDLEFLKRYVDLTRQLAEHEVDQFMQAFASSSVAESAELGARGVASANELLSLLHTRAIEERVKEFVNRN